MESVTLDRYDINLLHALQKRGRISWVELSEAVNLSASACQRRVKTLEKTGVIECYEAKINPVKVGFDVEAFVAVNVERQNYQLAHEFRQALLNKPEVLECYLLSGSIDFMLHVVATDLRAFGQFIQREILSLPGVKDATSSIVLEQIKNVGPAPAISKR